MALSLAELLVPSTRKDLVTTGLALLELLGFPVNSWDKTADIRALLEFDSLALEDFGTWIAAVASGGVLSKAEGPWLDLIAAWYSETRKLAIATRGTVTLTDSSGGIRNFADGELWWQSSATKRTYKNVGAIVVPASGSTPATIVATEDGADGNAQGSTIEFLTPPTQLTLAVASGTTWITTSGANEEGDADLRVRLLAKWGALTTAGIDAAYRYFALSASSEVTRVVVTEDQTAVYPDPAVTVRIATPAGAPAAALVAAVDAIIQAKRPMGVLVETAGAVNRTLDLNATLYVTAAGEAAARAAHSAEVARIQRETPIGGKVQVADLYESFLAPAGVTNAKVTKLGATTNPIPVTDDLFLLGDEVPVFVFTPTYVVG